MLCFRVSKAVPWLSSLECACCKKSGFIFVSGGVGKRWELIKKIQMSTS